MKTVMSEEKLKKAISRLLKSNEVVALARLLVANEILWRQRPELTDFIVENLRDLVDLESIPIQVTSAREVSIVRELFPPDVRLFLDFGGEPGMYLAHEVVDSLRAVGGNLHTLIVDSVNFGNIDLLKELFCTQRPSLTRLALNDVCLTDPGLEILSSQRIKSVSIGGISIHRSEFEKFASYLKNCEHLFLAISLC